VLFAAALAVYGFLNRGRPAELDYFVPLADAFLHGRLDLAEHPPWLNELVPFDGRWFVVYPPMPAIVLLPLVLLLGPELDQAGVSILLGAITVALTWLVGRGLGLGERRAALFGFLFGFGTIFWYSAQAGSSWHFAHVCATFFMFLAIIAVQRDSSPLVIGLLLGAAALSRLPTVLAVPFFAAWLAYRHSDQYVPGMPFGALRGRRPPFWQARLDRPAVLRAGTLAAIGLALPLGLYLLYNLARFGSPFQAGYEWIPGLLQEYQYRHGFFSYHNIGRNLYALLLTPPRQVEQFPYIQPANLGGLSILLTTPVFLWSLRSRNPDWFNVGAWSAVALILIPVLLHADPGGSQFGYRYALDFYPFLLLLTMRALRTRISFEALIAIVIGVLINAWGMWAIYTDWLQ